MFTIRRSGFSTAGEITTNIIRDLLANGFTAVFPQNWTPPETVSQSFTIVLEAGGDVDPLNKVDVTTKQPWRIRFQVYDAYTLGISCGSSMTLNDTGVDSWSIVGGAVQGPVGVVGATYTTVDGTYKRPLATSQTQGFINRRNRVVVGANDMSASYPMSYLLTVTDRGVFFTVWEDALSVESTQFSWLLVQRPVERKTGVTVVNGKAPVFAVSSVGNVINRFVVRESDVMRPSNSVDATVDSDGFNAIINKEEQVAISENNRYIVNFPSRLNTNRYAYTYELDMIGYTGADVVSENTDIPLEVYATNRVYTSTHSNGPNNTKMRLVALKSVTPTAP